MIAFKSVRFKSLKKCDILLLKQGWDRSNSESPQLLISFTPLKPHRPTISLPPQGGRLLGPGTRPPPPLQALRAHLVTKGQWLLAILMGRT